MLGRDENIVCPDCGIKWKYKSWFNGRIEFSWHTCKADG